MIENTSIIETKIIGNQKGIVKPVTVFINLHTELHAL